MLTVSRCVERRMVFVLVGENYKSKLLAAFPTALRFFGVCLLGSFCVKSV